VPAKTPSDPYTLCLKWLAARELSEFQIRQRLRARRVSPETINDVIAELRSGGALDDRRTALAFTRTDALVKRHGRTRAMRQLQSMGIDNEVARSAVREVFEDVDERKLMERALDGRIGHRGRTINNPAEYRRLFAFLVRQGFDASAVTALLRVRARGAARPDED